jgi:antitoxin ParD1/3/4
MTITLNPDLQAFLTEQVRLGKYETMEQAIADAVQRMKNREEKLQWLRCELQVGIDQLDRGEAADWDVDELKAKLRAKYPNA